MEVDRLHYFEHTLSAYQNLLTKQKENQKRFYTSFLIIAQKDKLKQGEVYEAEVTLVRRRADSSSAPSRDSIPT